MLNLSNGAVTVKRKLSVRETAWVIRSLSLTLKRKYGPASLFYPCVTNQRSEKISSQEKNEKDWRRQYLCGGLDPLWSSKRSSRFQMSFPNFVSVGTRIYSHSNLVGIPKEKWLKGDNWETLTGWHKLQVIFKTWLDPYYYPQNA